MLTSAGHRPASVVTHTAATAPPPRLLPSTGGPGCPGAVVAGPVERGEPLQLQGGEGGRRVALPGVHADAERRALEGNLHRDPHRGCGVGRAFGWLFPVGEGGLTSGRPDKGRRGGWSRTPFLLDQEQRLGGGGTPSTKIVAQSRDQFSTPRKALG